MANRRRDWRIRALPILAALLFFSCRSSSTFIPPQPAPEGKSRPAPPDIAILESPHDLREDYVYPPNGTSEIIRWQDDKVTWTLRFASRQYSYGDIVFSHAFDFSHVRPKTYLTFQLKPAYMANYLTVGLVDADITPSHVLVDVPLVRDAPESGNDWKTFRISFADFGDQGFPVTSTGENTTGDREPFDWSDVREMRFSTFGTIPRQEIVIRDIHLRR